MRLRTKAHRILRGYTTTWNHSHGSNQNARGSGLASTNHGNRCTIVLRLHRILSIFHPQLLQDRETPPTADKKRFSLGVGTRPKTSVRTPEDANVPTPSTRPTELQQIVRRTHRRISLWRGRHTLTGGRNTPKRQNFETITPPHSLLLSHVHSSRKKLRHLRMRTSSCSQSAKTLETPSRRLSFPLYCSHRPRQPCILEGTKRSQPMSPPLGSVEVKGSVVVREQ